MMSIESRATTITVPPSPAPNGDVETCAPSIRRNCPVVMVTLPLAIILFDELVVNILLKLTLDGDSNTPRKSTDSDAVIAMFPLSPVPFADVEI